MLHPRVRASLLDVAHRVAYEKRWSSHHVSCLARAISPSEPGSGDDARAPGTAAAGLPQPSQLAWPEQILPSSGKVAAPSLGSTARCRAQWPGPLIP